MSTKGCVAMILAGGRGERLGSLTSHYSKPAVHFGGNRLIDFTLKNCRKSGIQNTGILSQYFSTELCAHVGEYSSENPGDGNFYMLPSQSNDNLYSGTADAVKKNIDFVNSFDPESVLILAGDHIYDMDYNEMIDFHNESGADVTMAATPVHTKDASRYGILNADKSGRVYCFEEKPLCPKGNIASMGIYVFKWSTLKKYLLADSRSLKSCHDFGKDIVPRMLYDCELVYAYMYDGYWRDVGTVGSLWKANMEQIDNSPGINLSGINEPYADCLHLNLAEDAVISQSIVSGGCSVFGKVEHSVLGDSVTIGPGAEIVNSVIMPNAYIGSYARISNAIIGTSASITDGTVIGTNDGTSFFTDKKLCSKGISLVSPWLHINESLRVRGNSHITQKRLDEWSTGESNATMPSESPHRRIEYRLHALRRQSAVLEYH